MKPPKSHEAGGGGGRWPAAHTCVPSVGMVLAGLPPIAPGAEKGDGEGAGDAERGTRGSPTEKEEAGAGQRRGRGAGGRLARTCALTSSTSLPLSLSPLSRRLPPTPHNPGTSVNPRRAGAHHAPGGPQAARWQRVLTPNTTMTTAFCLCPSLPTRLRAHQFSPRTPAARAPGLGASCTTWPGGRARGARPGGAPGGRGRGFTVFLVVFFRAPTDHFFSF